MRYEIEIVAHEVVLDPVEDRYWLRYCTETTTGAVTCTMWTRDDHPLIALTADWAEQEARERIEQLKEDCKQWAQEPLPNPPWVGPKWSFEENDDTA
jgi:hypothetical protein